MSILELETLKPRVGVGVLILKDGKVLLGKRRGSHGAGCYNIPGGHLMYKESVEDCAARELEEETGLKIIDWQFGPWAQNIIDDKHYLSVLVIVKEFEGTPKLLEPEKCEGWEWHALDQLPAPLFPALESFLSTMQLNTRSWDKA